MVKYLAGFGGGGGELSNAGRFPEAKSGIQRQESRQRGCTSVFRTVSFCTVFTRSALG